MEFNNSPPTTSSDYEQTNTVELTDKHGNELFDQVIADQRAAEYQRLFDQVYDPEAGPKDGLTQKQQAEQATQTFLELTASLGVGERPAEDLQLLGDLYASMAITRPEAYSLLSGHYALAMRAIKQLGGRTADGQLYPSTQLLLDRLANGKALGVFSLTEAAVGSNAKDLRTTATYDKTRNVFIIHTPDDPNTPEGVLSSARKIPPNVAMDIPTVNVVAARIITEEGDQGIGVFAMPLHSDDQPAGIQLRPMSDKASAPMSHAEVSYNNVEIPIEWWLPGSNAGIENGKYYNTEPDHRKRYHEVIESLGWGRIGLTAGTVASVQAALSLLVPYAARRSGGGKNKLLENDDVLRDLASDVVHGFAMTALSNSVRRYASQENADQNKVELLAWLEKSACTQKAREIVQRCADRTGFRAHFRKNLFPLYLGHIQGSLTAEGESRTLEVSAGRMIIGQTLRGNAPDLTIADYAADNTVSELNLGTLLSERAQTFPDPEQLTRHPNQTAKNLAVAATERLTYDAMREATERLHGSARQAMHLMTDIYTIEKIVASSLWYRQRGLMTQDQEFKLEDQLEKRYDQLAPLIPQLVKSFAIPGELLKAPVASDDYATIYT